MDSFDLEENMSDATADDVTGIQSEKIVGDGGIDHVSYQSTRSASTEPSQKRPRWSGKSSTEFPLEEQVTLLRQQVVCFQ